MIKHFKFSPAVFCVALLLGTTAHFGLVHAAETGLEQYAGDVAVQFADPAAAVDAFKAALNANDADGLAKILGLDPAKLKGVEGIKDRFAEIRASASKLVSVTEDGDQRIVNIGREVWPFPFPLRQTADGKWAFNTQAGLEEIVNRRIGQNEISAIATARAYVDAQRDYAAEDHDGDGVLEYAQKLVSDQGKTDGLYWPIEQGDGESPAGPSVADAELRNAQTTGGGYFGYHFRILTGQGDGVAGGKYDYVINDNMIAGFALIAWPASYAETGVNSFVVNHAGIVYEKDLGADTEAIANGTLRFDLDNTWAIVQD